MCVCVPVYTLHTLPRDHHDDGFQDDLFLAVVSDLKIGFKGWELRLSGTEMWFLVAPLTRARRTENTVSLC